MARRKVTYVLMGPMLLFCVGELYLFQMRTLLAVSRAASAVTIETVHRPPPLTRVRKLKVSNFTEEREHALDQLEPYMDGNETVREHLDYYGEKPIIYFITPTYRRPSQMVDMIRLSQTLATDVHIYWIVIEDADKCTHRIRKVLERSGLLFAHVAIKSPKKKDNPAGHRGVHQRNLALDVLQTQLIPMQGGVAYFGDDDNGYDIRLFDEIRKTKRVSVFAVAFLAGGYYQRCQVDRETGRVEKLLTNWGQSRRFPIDMGQLAIHTTVIEEKSPRFSPKADKGHLETSFVSQMVPSISTLEPLAENCTVIYAWHVKTQPRYQDLAPLGGDPLRESLANAVV